MMKNMEDNGQRRFYWNKTVLITGGCGSIGSELVKKILEYKPKAIRIFDNNETGLFDLEQELHSDKIRTFIGDIRDKDRINRAVEDVDIIFHAAALKHVPLCEYNPFEAVKTNVIGTQNLIEAAMANNVSRFIIISTDKAVNPINVMGASKLLAERLTISANYYQGKRSNKFSCVRFGNVINTRGSIVPLIKSQMQNNQPITVTNPKMTRFIMGMPQAVKLILNVAQIAEGGEIFILKMPVIELGDFIESIIQYFGTKHHLSKDVKLQYIGPRMGEKQYEELLTEKEALNAFENKEMFVILPHHVLSEDVVSYWNKKGFHKSDKKRYTSKNQKKLLKPQIDDLLKELDIQ
jgi:FlaA1/EpsC-like NDP-sugar epimerase